MREHAQGDRRREPDADGERLLERRMPRVERRHQEHAEERRGAEVVVEGRSQLHLLIVNEIRHEEDPPGGSRLILRRPDGLESEPWILSRDSRGEVTRTWKARIIAAYINNNLVAHELQ